jgi:hypothetical protein
VAHDQFRHQAAGASDGHELAAAKRNDLLQQPAGKGRANSRVINRLTLTSMLDLQNLVRTVRPDEGLNQPSTGSSCDLLDHLVEEAEHRARRHVDPTAVARARLNERWGVQVILKKR